MTTLRFYGGAGEIGGNKILLEDRDTRVWFDFGENFQSGEDYFIDWLQPRGVAGLKDYFEFGLMPKLRGLYSRGALKFTDFEHVDSEFDAIFISHCHWDHIAHIQFVDERIPVYLGEVTKRIVEAWETSSRNKFGEHDYRTFKTGKRVRVGSIEVEPIHVDHSVPAAYGFIVHTSEGAVVYTGDFRMHGPRADMTQEFVERAKEAKPLAMLCDGARVEPGERRKNYSEEGVRVESDRVISGSKKLVVAAFYGRDVDRMRTFFQVAKDNGRQFVVSTKAALLLDSLKRDMEVPKLGEDFLVYAQLKKSGTFAEDDYYKWERPFLKHSIKFEDVQKNQSGVLLNLDFYDFAELVDIRPDGGDFIHSMSEPFSEEDLEQEVMQNWLKHFGLRFHQIHASGHCSRAEIGSIVKEVGPRKLFPVHTEHPELFGGLAREVRERIELGKPYSI